MNLGTVLPFLHSSANCQNYVHFCDLSLDMGFWLFLESGVKVVTMEVADPLFL